MKANALFNLHKKQQDILYLIIDCDNRTRSKEMDLRTSIKQGRNNCWFPENIKWLEERISRNKAIKNRLIMYYIAVQERINKLQPEIIELTPTEADILNQKNLS